MDHTPLCMRLILLLLDHVLSQSVYLFEAYFCWITYSHKALYSHKYSDANIRSHYALFTWIIPRNYPRIYPAIHQRCCLLVPTSIPQNLPHQLTRYLLWLSLSFVLCRFRLSLWSPWPRNSPVVDRGGLCWTGTPKLNKQKRKREWWSKKEKP